MNKNNLLTWVVVTVSAVGVLGVMGWAAVNKSPVRVNSKAAGLCKFGSAMSLREAFENAGVVCGLNLMDQDGVTELPPQIGELVNLEELHLGGTAIQKLPGEIRGLKKLRVLDLMDVPIRELPVEVGELENLRVLDLSDTGLTSFPEVVLKLKNLETLNLEFVNVGHIPDSITRLTRLKVLDVIGVIMTESDKDRLKSLLPKVNIIGLE